MTTPREQLIEAIAKALHRVNCIACVGAEPLRQPEHAMQSYERPAESAIDALSDLGAVVLMPLKVKQIPEGSKVHLSPPIVSLNWPEGAYRPFVNGDSRVYVNALEGQR
jgi:hypothetical protein